MKKIVERIRKILSLAGNNPSEKEAALAAEKAQELLIRHNLTMADVPLSSAAAERVVEEFGESGRWRAYEKSLMTVVAKAHLCKALIGRKGIVSFIGRESNAQVARYMFGYLRETIYRLGLESWMENKPKFHGVHGKTYIGSFGLGAVKRIGERLDTRRFGNGGTRALVLREGAAASRFIAGKYRVRKSRASVRSFSSGAYENGVEAGRHVTLAAGGVGAGNRRRMLGPER